MGRPAFTDEQRAAMRQRIREAAIALYREAGLEALTIRGVAKQAGFAPSVLYAYYPNRQALLQSLWYEPVVSAVREIIRVAADIADPLDRIEAMLAVYIDFARQNPEIYRGAFMFVRPGSMDKPPVQDLEILDLHRLLQVAIEEGQRTGQLQDGNSRDLAQALWAGIHGGLALPVSVEMFAFNESVVLAGQTLGLMLNGLKRPVVGG